MTDDADGPQDLLRARSLGGLTSLTVAIVTGSALALAARSNAGLTAAVIGATIAVAAFAFAAGRVAGEQIAPRGWLVALAIGASGGISALLAAAVAAALAGGVWSLHDGGRDPQLFYNYLVKPFLFVWAYGCLVAPLIGMVTGLIIRGVIGRARPTA